MTLPVRNIVREALLDYRKPHLAKCLGRRRFVPFSHCSTYPYIHCIIQHAIN